MKSIALILLVGMLGSASPQAFAEVQKKKAKLNPRDTEVELLKKELARLNEQLRNMSQQQRTIRTGLWTCAAQCGSPSEFDGRLITFPIEETSPTLEFAFQDLQADCQGRIATAVAIIGTSDLGNGRVGLTHATPANACAFDPNAGDIVPLSALGLTPPEVTAEPHVKDVARGGEAAVTADAEDSPASQPR